MKGQATVRLALPRLRLIGPETVAAYGVRPGPAGSWQDGGQASLREIATAHPRARIEACLHPESCSLARATMPPLPEKRRRIAVLGEIESLALGDVGQLAVAYGPREADGGVPLAWLPRQDLEQAMAQLRAIGLKIAALYPAPFFLPVLSDGPAWVVRDGWRITRSGPDSGLVAFTGESESGFELESGFGGELNGNGNGQCERWSGPAPSWSLPLDSAAAPAGQGGRRWAWAGGALAAAVLVWVVGLNLHAQRLASHGQALQAHMRARVQATFPELPVVVNPLQQARQQRDARQAGASDTGEPGFSRMVRAVLTHLEGLDGQVQALRYRDGQLSVELRGGTPPSPADAAAVAERVREAGLTVHASPHGWIVQGQAGASPGAALAAEPIAPATAVRQLARGRPQPAGPGAGG